MPWDTRRLTILSPHNAGQLVNNRSTADRRPVCFDKPWTRPCFAFLECTVVIGMITRGLACSQGQPQGQCIRRVTYRQYRVQSGILPNIRKSAAQFEKLCGSLMENLLLLASNGRPNGILAFLNSLVVFEFCSRRKNSSILHNALWYAGRICYATAYQA
jgi:hypothetical protein